MRIGQTIVIASGLFLTSCNLSGTQENASMKNTSDASEEKELFRNPLKLSIDKYTEWYEQEDHGLLVTKKIGAYNYAAAYKPYEYEVIRGNSNRDSVNRDLKLTPGLQYFTFRISKENYNDELLKADISDVAEYGRRIEYFSFHVQNDIKLYDGNDTLDCAMVHYERTYGVAPFLTLVVSFPLTEREKDAYRQKKYPAYNTKTISFDDVVFGNGKINLTIDAESLNEMPAIETIK
jgi:hypothetical protein